MNKQFRNLGLAITMVSALCACTEEIENPEEVMDRFQQPGTPFYITTSIETKTVSNGMATRWEDNDQLGVFYAAAGDKEKFSSRRLFNRDKSRTNGFYGTIDKVNEPLALENDWYAFYPFNSYMTRPDGQSGYVTIGSYKGTPQTQNGLGETMSLSGANCPLWGTVTSVPEETQPSIPMHHMSTAIRVNVTNRSGQSVDIKNISVSVSGKSLTGNFFPNFIAKEGFKLIPRSNNTFDEAPLEVTNGTLSSGATGHFYIICAPFSMENGNAIRVKVNNCIKEKIVNRTNVFEPGEITDINFTYNVRPGENVIPWVEDFASGAAAMDNYPGSTGSEVMKGDSYAKGTAPELMIRKKAADATDFNKFVATINLGNISSGTTLTLSFKTNSPEYIDMSSTTPNIRFSKKGDTSYDISINSLPSDRKLNLTFSNKSSSKNVRLDDIQLTGWLYTPDLRFEKDKIVVKTGAEITSQQVLGANTKVTYRSDNNKIAYVDPNTGTVSLNGGIGKAVITATSEASLTYAQAEAKYSVVVEPIPVQAAQGARTYILVATHPNTGAVSLLSSELTSDGKYMKAVSPEDYGSSFVNGEYLARDRSLLWNLNHLAGEITTLQREVDHYFLHHDSSGYGYFSSFYSATRFTLSGVPNDVHNILSYAQSDGQRVILNYIENKGFAFLPGVNNNIKFQLIPAAVDDRPALAAPQVRIDVNAAHDGFTVGWDRVLSAESYHLYIDNVPIDIQQNSLSATVSNQSYGKHTVKVVAVATGFIDGKTTKEVYLEDPASAGNLKITLDFSNGNNALGVNVSGSYATPTQVSDGTNSFVVSGDVRYFESKALLIASGAYLELPALPGKRLKQISVINAQGASTSCAMAIKTTAGAAVTGGDSQVLTPEQVKTWTLTGTQANTPYRMVTTAKKPQLTKIEISYENI